MREKQAYKTKLGEKSSMFHSKKPKIEDIFQGCLRFLDSKGTNGSAPTLFKKGFLDQPYYQTLL